MADHSITLHDLRVVAWIGVPAEERAVPQTLALTVRLTPTTAFSRLGDAIEKTVDYYQVAVFCRDCAASRPRALIETLADELAEAILSRWPVVEVTVEVKKFILPDCAAVSAAVTRRRDLTVPPERPAP